MIVSRVPFRNFLVLRAQAFFGFFCLAEEDRETFGGLIVAKCYLPLSVFGFEVLFGLEHASAFVALLSGARFWFGGSNEFYLLVF